MISSRISEGTFRPPGNLFLRLIWRSFRPSVAWCFGVAKGAFWRLAAPPLVAAPAAAGAAAAGPAAAIALFFPESRRDVKPRGSMFLEVVPSFSSMVFRCGEGCVLEACSTTSSSTTRSMQQEQQQQPQQQQAQQAQQAQQLNSLCFYQNPEGTSSPGAHVFGGRSVLQ